MKKAATLKVASKETKSGGAAPVPPVKTEYSDLEVLLAKVRYVFHRGEREQQDVMKTVIEKVYAKASGEGVADGSAVHDTAVPEKRDMRTIVQAINKMDDDLSEDVEFVAAIQDVLFCAVGGPSILQDDTVAALTSETIGRMTKIRDRIHELTEFATGNLTEKEEAAQG